MTRHIASRCVTTKLRSNFAGNILGNDFDADIESIYYTTNVIVTRDQACTDYNDEVDVA